MITEFSSFIEPKKGDWVLCDRGPGRPEINNFIKNNVGRIINLKSLSSINPAGVNMFINNEKYYVIKFYNIPQNIIDFFNFVGTTNGKWEGCRDIPVKDIIYWSKDKEDVEERISANKYNL